MIDYLTLKATAQRLGKSPSELLALAPQNDPFYVGAKRQLQKGRWFAEIYRLMGSPARCHIRRVHYWLVTTQAIPKPDGKPYENTQNDWSILNLAAKYARYLGLVPIENIIDRRNPDPQINTQFWAHKMPSSIRDSIDEANIIDSIVEQFYCYNPSLTQAYMLECWCEKSTMNDVLEPICKQYGMNLVTGLGELSITSVYMLAKRIVQAKKPVRILYISDFDPAGECMPLSVSRKIEYFARNFADLSHSDIKLIPLMLTSEQCREYNLPRTPIKESERRKDGFENRHGVGATELDALEALHPGVMREIIRSAVDQYFYYDLWNEAVRKNKEVQNKVREYLLGCDCPDCNQGTQTKEIPCPECKGLRCQECTQLGYVYYDIDCKTCHGHWHKPGKIGTEILSDLDTDEIDKYSPNTAISSAEDDENGLFLYDSQLDYVDQIGVYRKHKAQGSETSLQSGSDSDPDFESQ